MQYGHKERQAHVIMSDRYYVAIEEYVRTNLIDATI